MESKRVGLTIVLAIPFGMALAGYWLIKPKSEVKIALKREVALGYAVDPHLFLTVKSIHLPGGAAAGSWLLLEVEAKNTGVKVKINLADLRFAIQERSEGYSESAVASWARENGHVLEGDLLLPGQQAIGNVRLRLPAQLDASAVLIWREATWYKWAPFVRKTILNHRLRIEMSELIKAAA